MGAETKSTEGEESGAKPARDVRLYIYAGFDFAFAVVYTVMINFVAPTRHGSGKLLLWAIVGSVGLMGVGMLMKGRWGWRAAAGASGLLLVLELLLLIGILMSAAFLAGVYGAFGRGASMIAILAAVLTIQMIALLPALQLKYLCTRAGRRAFGLKPLWP
jgi:hypothetical protein